MSIELRNKRPADDIIRRDVYVDGEYIGFTETRDPYKAKIRNVAGGDSRFYVLAGTEVDVSVYEYFTQEHGYIACWFDRRKED